LGVAYARNTAFKKAKGEYVAYMDDDAVADTRWLESILKAFESIEPKPKAIAGKIILVLDKPIPKWWPKEFEILLGAYDIGDIGKWSDYLIGSNMAFRKECLESIGGFDNNLGRKGKSLESHEETALCERILKDGYIYYEPRAEVRHYVHPERLSKWWLIKRMWGDGYSLAQWDKKTNRTSPSSFYYFIKNLSSAAIKAIRSIAKTKNSERFYLIGIASRDLARSSFIFVNKYKKYGLLKMFLITFSKTPRVMNDVFRYCTHNFKKGAAISNKSTSQKNERASCDFPIIDLSEKHVLMGPGFMNYHGGVLNPGGLAHHDEIILLPRGELFSLEEIVRNLKCCVNSNAPILVHLDKELYIRNSQIIPVIDYPDLNTTRLEDFRLFTFKKKCYSNFNIVKPDLNDETDPINLNVRRDIQAIGELDLDDGKLHYMGQVKLDFKMKKREKNFVYFEQDGILYMIYSFSPYILLKATHWPELTFKTVIKEKMGCTLKKDKDGMSGRLSINPVEYDKNNLLLFVHRRSEKYSFWAVLIDRSSLIPTKITSQPVLTSDHAGGANPHIVYVTSVIMLGDDILLFFGEGDSQTSCVKIKKQEIDKFFVPIQ